MRWNKRGVIYIPDGTLPWAKTHAMLPTPECLSSDRLRLYLTFCDHQGVGRTGFIDVDRRDPRRVLDVSPKPVLDIGSPGTFDENGVAACSSVNLPDGRTYLYYVGFELGTKIRYRLLTGLAISRDGGASFQRLRQTPVLERTDTELFFRCGPFAMLDNGLFKLWYVAGDRWTEIEGKSMPVYVIKYLESPDGIQWGDEGRVCIDLEHDREHGFGRPYVVRDPDRYRMFYSIRIRSKGYRLGYAESDDGLRWTRKDAEIGLDVSPSGWDSRSVCYAAVIRIDGRLHMFYNGNEFGRTGVGYAVSED